MLFKRILSAATGMAMAFTMLAAVPSSAEQATLSQGNSAQISNDELNIEGTNSFGRMLASALDEKADEQNEGNGCNVFSVDVTGNTASVE